MLNKINFGVVGLGHLGKFHVEQAQKIQTFNIVGVYDIDSKIAANISKKYSVNCFKSVEELCVGCDAISIVCSTGAHFKTAMIALKMGCHVFIEKPITSTVNQGKQLIAYANNNKLKIQVGHIERFNPAFVSYLKTKPKPLFIESHRLSPFNVRGSDVAVVLDLMIHDIDLVLSLIKSEIVDIQASGASVVSNFIDLANARLAFRCGTTVNLTASRISTKQMREMRVFEKLRYTKINFHTSLVIQNTIKNKKTIEKNLKIKKDNALFLELQSFARSIINKSKTVVSGEDGLNALRVATKIQNIIENR